MKTNFKRNNSSVYSIIPNIWDATHYAFKSVMEQSNGYNSVYV